MPTIAQLYQRYVGKPALLTVLDYAPQEATEARPRATDGSTGIQIPVWICDARLQYGSDAVLVQPVFGAGSTWVKAGDRLLVMEKWPPHIEKMLKDVNIHEAPKSDESVRAAVDSA